MNRTLRTCYIVCSLLLIAVLFFSCKTAEEKALAHIKKAEKLYPGIISHVTTDTTISFNINDTLYIPGDTVTVGIPCDSLLSELDKMQDSLNKLGSLKPATIIVKQQGKNTITASKGSSGGVTVDFTRQRDTIYKEIPVVKTITVPGKQIAYPVEKAFYKYPWFWLLLLIIAILILILTRRKN
jgi:hypothetical protein